MTHWNELQNAIDGELRLDNASRIAMATDASVYRRIPLAVVYPKHRTDLSEIVKFAGRHSIPLIPRAAGTSLAGQCVGEGLIVDVSRHFNRIIHLDSDKNLVDVEPGVIRDDLNRYVQPHGLFFGPNTSTASRCMVGGMVGNNSCGTTSIKYGTTRDKVVEVEAILADGSVAVFGEKSVAELEKIIAEDTLEASIYREMVTLFSGDGIINQIKENYPKATIHRRNTGYAIDELIDRQPFNPEGQPLQFGKIIAGSEGTLGLITRVRLQLDPLPPAEGAVCCVHFTTLRQSMEAAVLAMKFEPFACELMDRTILELTRGNREQAENRFFVEGDPAAILVVELRDSTPAGLEDQLDKFIERFRREGLGYAFPVVHYPDILKVWALRAAGLGVLSNMPGDARPVAFVEDTAVAIEDLPAYIAEFEELMRSFDQEAVYYAHAGAGELHLRPVLDLKTSKGRRDFRSIGEASARLVKKYNGSLSGEHGDGRVRAEFIPQMIGEANYQLLRKLKKIWDPQGIFNPGKIVDALPMDADFRYEGEQPTFSYDTFLDFGSENMLQSAERCNGSGDCRNPQASGAAMCPSYQATRHELDSTRARANVLREVLTRAEHREAAFTSPDAAGVLDLCLSCKACKRECPSGVDMAALKAEYMYQFQEHNGYSRRTRFFGNFHRHAALAAPFATVINPILRFRPLAGWFRKFMSIAPERSIPPFSRHRGSVRAFRYASDNRRLDFILYIDEFTEFQDADVAEAAAQFFQKLGFQFQVVYGVSCRAAMSKGMLKEARSHAENTLGKLSACLDHSLPVVGLEPSAILGFKDDFIKLVRSEFRDKAEKLATLTFTFEEYVASAIEAGKIKKENFTERNAEIHIQLHCHQKALSHIRFSKYILNFPLNYKALAIPSGCCGMAGSFGYEAEHYDLSQKIGEMILFPHLRKYPDVIVAASGTSCRHQIKDAVRKQALHPAQILLEALR